MNLITRRAIQSRRERIDLRIDIVRIVDVQITQHFEHVELFILLIEVGREQADRKIHKIGERAWSDDVFDRILRLEEIENDRSDERGVLRIGLISISVRLNINVRQLYLRRIIRRIRKIESQIDIVQPIRNEEIFKAELESINERRVHRERLNERLRLKSNRIAIYNPDERDRTEVARSQVHRIAMVEIYVRPLIPSAAQEHKTH